MALICFDILNSIQDRGDGARLPRQVWLPAAVLGVLWSPCNGQREVFEGDYKNKVKPIVNETAAEKSAAS